MTTTLELNKCKWPAKTGFYTDILANWPSEAGKKPAMWHHAVSHLVYAKKRPGVEQGFIAMLLRDNGATVNEFQLAFHCKPAFNNMRHMVKMGVIKIEPVGSERPQRLKATVTPRGISYIEAQIAANEAETANTKAGKVTKPRKPKREPKVTGAYLHNDGEVSGDLGIEGAVTATTLPDGSVVLNRDLDVDPVLDQGNDD